MLMLLSFQKKMISVFYAVIYHSKELIQFDWKSWTIIWIIMIQDNGKSEHRYFSNQWTKMDCKMTIMSTTVGKNPLEELE